MSKKIFVSKKVFSKIVLVMIAFAVIAATTGCGKKKEKKSEEVEASFAVTTYKVSSGKLDDYLEFGGDVVASSVVNVLPDTGGKLSGIRVAVGDYVRRDQVMAYLDPSKPGMNYAASPVKAPVSGTVTSFPLTLGATCTTQTAIAQISSTGKLEIRCNIAERFISRIKNGQRATIQFDAYPGESFVARVFEVSPVLDTSTRTMRVKLSIDQTDSRIKAGMYARVKLVTDELNDAIIVPHNAIVNKADGTYVFAVSRTGSPKEGQTGAPGVASSIEVKAGIQVDDKTEIISGLSIGQEIVVRGQTLLSDGAAVNVISTTDGAEQ